jgi:Fe-S-cluster containining protein
MVFKRNPCMDCGACCAHFRISFYWGETDPERGGTVPIEMTDKLNDFRRCMQGTDQKNPRCVALAGTIGEGVACTIYENRPTPCREFGVDWTEQGLIFVDEDLARCTAARAAWGLPPVFEDPRYVDISPDDPLPIAG